MNNSINEQDIKEAFVDVRRAYRMIAQLQNRLSDLVFYIRSKTKFANSDIAGTKLFSNSIGYRRSKVNNYAQLRVFQDMWSWDYLYGYMFEYYFANTKIAQKTCAMSIITVCDDGFFISNEPNKNATSLKTFEKEENSESYILLVYGDGASGENWMRNKETDDYIYDFLSKQEQVDIYKDREGKTFIVKKYPMYKFYNQNQTDEILYEFAQIVKNEAGIQILNEYQ